MKKKNLLLTAALFLLAACSGTVDKGSPARVRFGNNNGITFQNILVGERRTEYGMSNIHFPAVGTYAVVSVPANEENVSTYFTAIVTPEKRTPKLVLMTYKNSPGFSLLLNGSNENLDMDVSGDQERSFEVGIRGKFTPYIQENIVLISFDNLHDKSELQKLSEAQLRNLGENTVFVVPYPWRTVKVRIEGGESSVYNELIAWANLNVFRQAIVRLELAEEGEEYDCRIILGQNISGGRDYAFLDESGNEFNPHRSNRIVAAQLRFDSLNFWKEDSDGTLQQYNSPERNAFLKKFSFAVAYLMGVSQGNSHNNLMLADDNTSNVHLTFQQWNQLHAKGGGR